MGMSKYPYPAFSGAIQQKSTPYIKKPTEVVSANNADFKTIIGAVRRRPGAQSTNASLPKLNVSASPLGAYIARFPAVDEIWAVQNNSAATPTSSILQYWTGAAWSNIQTGLQASVEANLTDDLDEVWVSLYDTAADTLYAPFTVDSAHSVSATRQLNFAPKARYFMEFNGAMWAFDCEVNGTRYRNRAYKSSGPTGAITFARSAQTDVSVTFDLVNQVPVMTSNTTPTGVAAASSILNASYDAFHAFDGSIDGSHEWAAASGTTTGWVSYDFTTTKIITAYSVVGCYDLEGSLTVGPKTWTFEGSNDNSSWTVLNTQTNVAAWTGGEKRTYSTTNTTAYRYYRINISANQGHPTYLTVAELGFLSSTTNVNLLQLELDSARYIKPGQVIDIYKAGTDTLEYTITVNDVDKANDIMKFLPDSQIFGTGGVNTGTDVITVADASKFTTGTPIKFLTTGTLPAGLSLSTTYYAIYVSSTTFKVATSTLNATLGVAVDITSTGSGNHTVQLSYIIGNKDELWAHGRKGKLTRFWNTDYRNPEAADWIKLPPTLDALDQINAVGKISSRLFMFTKHSTIRFDGQNIVPVRNDVGCIAHKSICYYDSFMLWLDAKGNIWARNEEAGTMDIISQPIQETLDTVPQSQLPQATAVCVDGTYKLYLGQVNGKTLRVVYEILTNQWSVETFTPKMPVQLEYVYNNQIHPHFFDETGQLWVDEEGNTDNGAIIPFDVIIGDDIFGVDEAKDYYGVKVYSSSSAAMKIMVSVDGGQFEDMGEITQRIQSVRFKKVLRGTMINIKLVDSSSVKEIQVDRVVVYYNMAEDTFRATR